MSRDRFRTVVNVAGDCFGAGIVYHFSKKKLAAADQIYPPPSPPSSPPSPQRGTKLSECAVSDSSPVPETKTEYKESTQSQGSCVCDRRDGEKSIVVTNCDLTRQPTTPSNISSPEETGDTRL